MEKEELLNLINEANKAAFGKFTQNKLEEAVIILNQTLKVQNNEKSLQLLGLINHKNENYPAAIKYFQKSLEFGPNAESYNNIAVCYSNLGKYRKSIKFIKKALTINQSFSLYNNLALQYRHLDQINKSIKYLKEALKIKDNETSWGMLGGCYGENKNLDEAEKCFKKALEINPNFAAAHVDLSCIYQLKGEWEKSWPEYEWRTDVYHQLKIWKEIYSPEKKWNNQDLNGKKIILHGEQGHGDSIHFFRYVALLKEKNPYIILHCSELLKPIFENQVNEVYTIDPLVVYNKKATLPEHDYHCSLVSLPFYLKTKTIPKAPYIFNENKIPLNSNKFKIGIAWAGNPQHPNDKFRSCYLKLFKPIENILNVELFSLMKDTRARAYKFGKNIINLIEDTEKMQITDLSNLINSFEDTAKIMNSLDLIITVDSAVLHLAGALGKKTFAMIPFNNDWRWTNQGDSTIWYSSVELFRQSKKGDWEEVIEKIKKRVEEISSTL